MHLSLVVSTLSTALRGVVVMSQVVLSCWHDVSRCLLSALLSGRRPEARTMGSGRDHGGTIALAGEARVDSQGVVFLSPDVFFVFGVLIVFLSV